MKAIKSKVTRGLPIGAKINIVDNSGARIIQLISVKGYKARTRQLATARVGDMITGSVIAGKQDVMHTLVQAVVVRQKKEFARPDGTRVKFDDNAAIVLRDVRLGMPKGTVIKGPIAKEAAIRWANVAKLANIIL